MQALRTFYGAAEGGVTITTTDGRNNDNKDNIYLFPNMLDQYQIQLTRMLEAEQYKEAKELLRFLIQCQGEDERNYDEWNSLLSWLDMAFPDDGGMEGGGSEDSGKDEEHMRGEALRPAEQDEAYVNQVLYIMQNHPMIDQQLLAIERAVYIDSPVVDATILEWLRQQPMLHPAVQFKALQCLRRRGVTGMIELERLGETAQLLIEETPLSLEDFPPAVIRIIERTESVVEVEDPTLPHFARELWKESLQFLYGTAPYQWMLQDEDMIECFAAALHLSVLLTVYGGANDDDIREAYGITESLRFKYEQVGKALRQVAVLGETEED